MWQHYSCIQKNGAFCTCFVVVVMIFISAPETFHFVDVTVFHAWLHVVDVLSVLLGVCKWCVYGFTQFYYFYFIYLPWFVPKFWHYVINLNYGEWLYSTAAQEIVYIIPVPVEKAYWSFNRKSLIDKSMHTYICHFIGHQMECWATESLLQGKLSTAKAVCQTVPFLSHRE